MPVLRTGVRWVDVELDGGGDAPCCWRCEQPEPCDAVEVMRDEEGEWAVPVHLACAAERMVA